MKVHHLGYLVKDISKSAKAFRSLGFVDKLYDDGSFICADPYRKCDICFMELNDGVSTTCIELVAPNTKESPIYGLMEKYKNTPYHICYESENLEEDMKNLKGNGWSVFIPPAVAPAIDGRNVVFLINRSAGIIELVEYIN